MHYSDYRREGQDIDIPKESPNLEGLDLVSFEQNRSYIFSFANYPKLVGDFIIKSYIDILNNDPLRAIPILNHFRTFVIIIRTLLRFEDNSSHTFPEDALNHTKIALFCHNINTLQLILKIINEAGNLEVLIGNLKILDTQDISRIINSIIHKHSYNKSIHNLLISYNPSASDLPEEQYYEELDNLNTALNTLIDIVNEAKLQDN